MSISVSIGAGDPTLLEELSGLKHAAGTFLKLGVEFKPFLNQPLSALPPSLSSTAIQYSSGNQTWAPGPITFTLSAGVSGRISVLTSGDLLTYTASFPTEVQLGALLPANPDASSDASAGANPDANRTLAVTAGVAYVVLELDFQISGGLSASYTSGIYGVSTDNTAASAVTVACYCACDPSTPLQNAVEAAFKRFVLPLHAETLAQLSVGDYLHYNFAGSLQVGMGATVGFEKVFYAGQYKYDIPKTGGGLSVCASAEPAVLAGAKLAFQYDYAGAFEVLLWRESGEGARLHLYRSRRQDTSLGLAVGIKFTAGSDASATVLNTQLASSLTQALPDRLQGNFTTKVLTPAIGEVGKYTDELNTKITSWLTPSNDKKCALDLAIESCRDRFLLADYAIDLAKNYAPAWQDMLAGRFVDAVGKAGSGVSLMVGSGTESLFTSTASVKLNLFGWHAASWSSETLSSTSLVYAGNNTFHLILNQGRELLTAINGGKKEVDIYFSAEADLTSKETVSPAVRLNVVLQATHNPGFGAYIAKIVKLLSSGPAGATLAQSVQGLAAQHNTVETLHLIFAPTAYGRLHAATILKGKPVNESLDRTNYEAFAVACGQLFTDPPANFQWAGKPLTYAIWRDNNIASNDEWPAPAGALPDRTSSAGYNPSAAAQLGSVFPGIGSVGQGVSYCFSAAAQFMGLCEDLCKLAEEDAITADSWNDLVQRLKTILKNDVNPYFIAPSAMALAALCGGAPTNVTGPAPELPTGSSIAVTMTYQ